MSTLAEKLSTRRLSGPETEPIILDRKRIYILPTAYGLLFSILLLIMLIGSINYNNSLGFALTFLMGSIATISMMHTHRNLAGLKIKTNTGRSVFCGQNASYPLIISNTGRIEKLSIILLHESRQTFIDIPANSTITSQLEMKTRKRGRLQIGRIKVCTGYPLGLFQAWSWIIPDSDCIVYPAPENNAPPPCFENTGTGNSQTSNKGLDEYFGLRLYQPGDPIKTIAWKQTARGNDVFTKQFTGSGGQTLWLEWDIIETSSLEHKLSRLCSWVLECETAGFNYGLRIPGNTIQPGNGHKHQHCCLTALALSYL